LKAEFCLDNWLSGGPCHRKLKISTIVPSWSLEWSNKECANASGWCMGECAYSVEIFALTWAQAVATLKKGQESLSFLASRLRLGLGLGVTRTRIINRSVMQCKASGVMRKHRAPVCVEVCRSRQECSKVQHIWEAFPVPVCPSHKPRSEAEIPWCVINLYQRSDTAPRGWRNGNKIPSIFLISAM
jgi:hypothetical protein